MLLESRDLILSNGMSKPIFRMAAVLTPCSCNIQYDEINHARNYKLATVDICKQPNEYKINDGFKSFPSGHSSSRLKLPIRMLYRY